MTKRHGFDRQLLESACAVPKSANVLCLVDYAMPIYGFECDACGHRFDRLQKLSDADPTVCPECGAEPLRRQLTAPSFRLSGSGWYETDFKKDGDKKRNLTEKGDGAPAEPRSDAKGDAKPAAEAKAAASDAKPTASTSSTAPAPAPAAKADPKPAPRPAAE
jgi:putative FmdB family regulatory protein